MSTSPRSTDTLFNATLWSGAIALFLIATAFGVLEVHSSNDTWIGLAAGRQILESPQFPKADTFSINFSGATWYNQNWLTHVIQYWVHEHFGPNAVIYFTWAMGACVFALSAAACYWRSGTWLGALIAASMVGIGCRDFLSARPATSGFFCISALWALVCALEGQGEKRRWWPIALFLPLLLFWGNAHGSFVFAYGMLGLYIGHWVFLRVVRPQWLRTSGKQMIALAVVLTIAFLLTLVISPFGWQNFTHGGVVASSSLWRKVQEWHPPYTYVRISFPPMVRFWWILGFTAAGLLAAWIIGWSVPRSSDPTAAESRRRLHTSLYDVGAVALALTMTIWARRFAPIFYIFAAPVFLTWIVMLLRSLHGRQLRLATSLFAGAVWLGAATLAVATVQRAYTELINPLSASKGNLFDRVTRRSETEALEYLARNEVELNLFTEWTLGGAVMFYAPTCKIFIDGRAQQVYTEEHYSNYLQFIAYGVRPEDRDRFLLNCGADGIFLRNFPNFESFSRWLYQSNDWTLVLNDRTYGIYIRRNSPALAKLRERVERGEEWRPSSPTALLGRGMIWATTSPRRLDKAMEAWTEAIDQYAMLGGLLYSPMIRAIVIQGGRDAGLRFVDERSEIVRNDPKLEPAERDSLLRSLEQIRTWVLSQATTPQTTPRP